MAALTGGILATLEAADGIEGRVGGPAFANFRPPSLFAVALPRRASSTAMDDDEDTGETQDFAGHLRRQAALTRNLADKERALAAEFGTLAGRDPVLLEIRRRSLHVAEGLDQVAALNAAQAIAYEDMIAAGGPDNARAYVEYEATTRRNIELHPRLGSSGD